jgi:ABC-type transport system substrate-binding protein
VAHGPLNAFTIGYDEGVVGMYEYDPAKAETLLEEAGWVESDGDGIRDKDGQPLKLEAYLMGWGYVPEVTQLLQAQFKAVGIEMESQVVAYPAALEAAREGKHHLVPFSLSSSDPDILRTFFHSSNADSGFNWSKIRGASGEWGTHVGPGQAQRTVRRSPATHHGRSLDPSHSRLRQFERDQRQGQGVALRSARLVSVVV